jgi:hypothetical protein
VSRQSDACTNFGFYCIFDMWGVWGKREGMKNQLRQGWLGGRGGGVPLCQLHGSASAKAKLKGFAN